MIPRERESGVALINVLAVIALASSVVAVMLTTQGDAIKRSQRFGDAAQALEIARGGVASARIALTRDLTSDADRIDHAAEPWSLVEETNTAIEGGVFSLSLRDATGRYNINNLYKGGAVAAGDFARIIEAADLPRTTAARVALVITENGPINRMQDLALIGVTPDEIARLSTLMTALPRRSKVNVNAASETLIALLLGNKVRANVLVAARERQGFLTPEDVRKAQVLLPPSMAYRSDFFVVDVEVRIGETAQRVRALLQKTRPGLSAGSSGGGGPKVVIPLFERAAVSR